MYIFNLVLACWLTNYNSDTEPYDYIKSGMTLENLISYWNRNPNRWECIHYPCIKEHFVMYENLPEDFKSMGK